MMKLIVFIQCLLVLACSGNLPQSNDIQNGKQIALDGHVNQYKLFHTFYSKDGVLLGEAFVLFKNSSEVFTSMLITKKISSKVDTLYIIDRTKLISKKGIDTEVYKEGFYGYKAILKRSDYIDLVLVNEKGEGVSDNMTIEWNYNEKQFELLKAP